MKKNKIFLYFCLLFVAGIALRSVFSFDLFYAFIFLLICLVLASLVWHNKVYRIILLGAFFLFLGILRFNISVPVIDENHIKHYNDSVIEFTGQISSEPDVREKHTKLILNNLELACRSPVELDVLEGSRGEGGKVQGKILVNAYKYGDYNYADWVKIECELNTPGIIESDNEFSRDFDYGRYLGVKGIYSTCYKPESIEKINNQYLTINNKIYKKLINSKQKFKEIIDANLPLPQSGLLNAMLLGYKRELLPEIADQFSQTGMSHIVAISGLHITIIAGILFYLFILLGVPRSKSFWPALTILFLYIIMIGFRASATRAFIMAALLLYALKIGRLSKSINALILAGSVLLIINPKLLLYDIGFQLSFLAVLGILYFYPLFNKWLEFISDKYKIRSIIGVTLSAQILTLPLVVYYFGILSIISPVANLLVLPILPVVMVGGMILIILGLIWAKLAFIFGILIWIILSYVLKVIELLSQIPYAFFKFKTINFIFIILVYILIFGFYIYIKNRTQKNTD